MVIGVKEDRIAASARGSWAHVVYEHLHRRSSRGLTVVQRILFAVIVLAVAVAILGTEPELDPGARHAMDLAEIVVGCIFLLEYCTRIWSIGVVEGYQGFAGRLRYARQPMPIVDLVALLPFLLGLLGAETLVLRMIRVLRLLALSKLVRYSDAMRTVLGSIIDRRYELMFAVLLAFLMLLFSSAAMYVVEGQDQPKAFGSILRAMWWSVVTLTTVGYGDAYPITPLGKFFAAITAVAGIGMIAMPTGILAASFSEAFAKIRVQKRECPPDGPQSNPGEVR